MVRNHIVVGLGYGDEGKGVLTDYLASTLDNAVVIRHNGGHQCGHTVRMPDGRAHVFSNFGAGTFRQVPVFFSNFCTIDPIGILNESDALSSMGVSPTLFVDPMAMVVTPFDKFFNINDNRNLSHGTVGVGFGACVERNLGPCKLFAQDLFYPPVLTRKLEAIKNYYRARLKANGIESSLAGLELEIMSIEPFWEAVGAVSGLISLMTERDLFAHRFDHFIFEGGQGILLDMEFGIYPNMTRSFTTSRNAFEILHRNNRAAETEIYYATRAYQTRHGNGWMSSEEHPVCLVNDQEETNTADGYQGAFRKGLLDLDMLDYALQCDANYAGNATKHLIVSCLDQMTSWQYTQNGQVVQVSDRESFLQAVTLCHSVLVNDSPRSETIVKWR